MPQKHTSNNAEAEHRSRAHTTEAEYTQKLLLVSQQTTSTKKGRHTQNTQQKQNSSNAPPGLVEVKYKIMNGIRV
ncbi:unnamed protein product [Camellia sinensis]